ncbi:MAG: cell division protein ZapA, partial [Eubacteriales bacterium]|nr:cell division protein ZapA [Eubacteriales bacterium]
MEEVRNKVNVKIYGQEFTISGELPRDQIIQIADYVDRKMQKLEESIPSCSLSSLAVLTAVNCADEYYKTVRLVKELESKNAQLEKDSQHYVQLWEEAKKNFLQYKEDAQSAIESKNELQTLFNERTVECNQLSSQLR